VAAAVLTLFWAFWAFLAARAPGDYPGQFMFPFEGQGETVAELWAVNQGKETHYQRRKTEKGYIFVDRDNKPWRRSEAILIKENSDKVRFDAERDARGYYKVEDGSVRYLDKNGRVMTETYIGYLPGARRWGLLFGNLLLNGVHLIVWFLCAWLLLRFQWGHALLAAVVAWVTVTLALLPMLVSRAEALASGR